VKARDLLGRHRAVWQKATRHLFLEGVREGTLPAGAFEEWLVQDYLFVLEGLGFQARLVPRAPRRDQALLIGGLVALEAELSWFEEQAERRELDLGRPRHPANAAYGDFLRELGSESYPAGITALWTLEQAYLDAWRGAAPGYPDYRPFVEHWTTPHFSEYVAGLERAADAALGEATGGERERAGAAFLEVVRLEKGFWDMALARGGG